MARTAASLAVAVALSANAALACDPNTITTQTQQIETVCCQGQSGALPFLRRTAPARHSIIYHHPGAATAEYTVPWTRAARPPALATRLIISAASEESLPLPSFDGHDDVCVPCSRSLYATKRAHTNPSFLHSSAGCNTGLPSECDETCAPVFKAFWEDCGAYLNYLPGTGGFTDFYQTCQHNDNLPSTTVSSCDSGNLLTLMFFTCADVDQLNPNTFCNTPCFTGVRDFVGRCSAQETGATSALYNQARAWMAKCPAVDRPKSCHSDTCGGATDTQCGTAHTKDGCHAITTGANPVSCSWQTCDDDVAPPPTPGGPPVPPPAPPQVISGCMDPTALNFMDDATVQADGACLYGGVGPVDPGFGQNCAQGSPWGCNTQVLCEGSQNQWVSCQAMTENQGCADCCQHSQGECVRPCAPGQPENCYTQAECTTAGTPTATSPDQTTQWVTPQANYEGTMPPGMPPPPPPTAQCERACSTHSMYTCRSQASCEAIHMQWKPPSRPVGTTGDFVEPGRCETPCDAGHYSDCITQAACTAVGMQWTLSQCCGDGCPPQGIGRCERPCTEHNPYSCRTEIACQAIGRQWVPEDNVNPNSATGGPNSRTCTGTANAGSCSAPCTRDNSYNCHTQTSCQAVGLEWHAPIVHGGSGTPDCPDCPTGDMGYTEPGHCSYPCSLMNPNECDTADECAGIGFQWISQDDENCPPGMVGCGGGGVEFGHVGMCEAPCSTSNPSGCQSQATCETNHNQWVVETMRYGGGICPDCGGIDGGFGGGGMISPGIEPPMIIPGGGRRQLQGAGPGIVVDPGIIVDPSTGDGQTYAHCEEQCSMTNIYACRDASACAGVGGAWRSYGNQPGGGPTDGAPVDMGGSCEPGCSVQNSYQCNTQTECEGIGGAFQERTQHFGPVYPGGGGIPPPPSPAIMFCNITLARCDLETFVGTCAASTAGGHSSAALCEADCGRFITSNYARCQREPPAGMTSSQFTEQFGPIVQMCHTINEDPQLERCASNMQEAAATLQRVCCDDDADCAANGGTPTTCTGDCADAFIPFFETCGPTLLQGDDASSLSTLYTVCTDSGSGQLHDPKLCSDNSGNSPWVAAEFRSGCSVWVKYIDAKTHTTSDFVRLVGVGKPMIATAQLLDVAKDVCGKLNMVKRFAEDFSGIMALSDMTERNTVALTINNPATGNTVVHATMSGANRDAVKGQWKGSYDVNQFNPDQCPQNNYGR